MAKTPISDKEMATQEKKVDEELQQEATVKVKIPLIDKNNPDIEVGINGVIKLIKRGVTVELPESIVEILEHANII